MTAAAPIGERFDIICIGDVAVDLYLTLAEEDCAVEADDAAVEQNVVGDMQHQFGVFLRLAEARGCGLGGVWWSLVAFFAARAVGSCGALWRAGEFRVKGEGGGGGVGGGVAC